METRANYVLIGAFTIGVVLAAFGFVFWLQGGSRGQATRRSASSSPARSELGQGLDGVVQRHQGRRGARRAPSPAGPAAVVAVVQVDPSTPLRADTRARLDSRDADRRLADLAVGRQRRRAPAQARLRRPDADDLRRFERHPGHDGGGQADRPARRRRLAAPRQGGGRQRGRDHPHAGQCRELLEDAVRGRSLHRRPRQGGGRTAPSTG